MDWLMSYFYLAQHQWSYVWDLFMGIGLSTGRFGLGLLESKFMLDKGRRAESKSGMDPKSRF